MGERPLHCTIRNPILLNIPDLKSEFHSGCRVIDVSLTNIINPEDNLPLQGLKGKSAKSNKSKHLDEIEEVGEIHFKNSYTAYVTVKGKCRIPDGKDGNEVKWRTWVKKHKLMASPHVEAGAQDYFVLSKKHVKFELVNVSALRIILQQPSPVWKEFKIEDLKIFRSSELVKPSPLPAWLTEPQDKKSKKKIELTSEDDRCPPIIANKDTNTMGINNLESVSACLQQLWALSEEVAANQTARCLGRYEVDSCYEINLLSYS